MSRTGTPNSMVLLDGSPLVEFNNVADNRPNSSNSNRKKYIAQNGRESSMEVISDNDDGSSGIYEKRPRSGSGLRRTPTPNKQVSLKAARKSEHSFDLDQASSRRSSNLTKRPDSSSSTSSGSSSTSRSTEVSTAPSSSQRLQRDPPRKGPDSRSKQIGSNTKSRLRPQTTNPVGGGGNTNRRPSARTLSPASPTGGRRNSRFIEKQRGSPSANTRGRRLSSISPTNTPRSSNQRRPSRSPVARGQSRSPVGGRRLNSSRRRPSKSPSERPLSKKGATKSAVSLASDIDDSDQFDTDLEDGESEEDSSDEEEEQKAPNELLLEFIQCLMDEDLENAKKLCKMVLIYEPTNPEACKFQELIDEKITLEAELALMSSESEDSGEGSSDEGSDGDSKDSSDSSTDSDSDDDSDSDNDSEGDTDSRRTSMASQSTVTTNGAA